MDRRGPDFLGAEHAEPAAFDHRRAAHPDGDVARGDDHVAAAEQRRVAGETAARNHPDQRHPSTQFGEVFERADKPPAVGVARSAAPALGEQHQRQTPALGELDQPIGLDVVARALGPCEHRVIVGHRRDPCPGVPELPGVDRTQAHDQAVRRAFLDQLFARGAAAAPGDRQPAIFDKAARIAEVVDVFPSGPLPGLAAAGDRIGAILVKRPAAPRLDFGEIGPDRVEIGLHRIVRLGGGLTRNGPQEQDGIAFGQCSAERGAERLDHPSARCGDAVLHLHRFDNRQFGPRGDRVADGDGQRDQGSEHRRLDRDRTGGRGHPGASGRLVRGGAGIVAPRRQRVLRGEQRIDPLLDQRDMAASCQHFRIGQQRPEKRDVGGHSGYREVRERAGRLGGSGGEPACGDRDNQLGEQRIVTRTGSAPRVAMAIDADAAAARRGITSDSPRRGACAPVGGHRLEVDPRLQREAARRRHLRLIEAQRGQLGSARDLQLQPHQVEAKHFLGDGMFDLNPGIGFDEGEAIAGGGDQEFHRAERA